MYRAQPTGLICPSHAIRPNSYQRPKPSVLNGIPHSWQQRRTKGLHRPRTAGGLRNAWTHCLGFPGVRAEAGLPVGFRNVSPGSRAPGRDIAAVGLSPPVAVDEDKKSLLRPKTAGGLREARGASLGVPRLFLCPPSGGQRKSLATTYSPTAVCRSTIGAGGLNCRVRNGNGWDPSAMVTRLQIVAIHKAVQAAGGCPAGATSGSGWVVVASALCVPESDVSEKTRVKPHGRLVLVS